MEYVKEGIRDTFTLALDSIYPRPTDWIIQKEQAKYPPWWDPLQDQFGRALQVVVRVLKEPRFLSMDESQSKIAAPLVVHILLVHLAHEMLTEFEKLKDLDGIRRICGFIVRLYSGMEEKGIPVAGDGSGSGDTGCRWSSIEQASQDLKGRLFANIDQTDPFKDLERVLQDDGDGASGSDSDPLADGSDSNSQHTTLDGNVAEAEETMDAYFIHGDIAASLACALVLVDDDRLTEASTLADRTRLWSKANLISESACAQQSLFECSTGGRGCEIHAEEKDLPDIEDRAQDCAPFTPHRNLSIARTWQTCIPKSVRGPAEPCL